MSSDQKEAELLLEAFNLQMPQDKKIDSSKLGEALRSVGKKLTNENVETLKKKADDECNGGLTFDDFKRFVEEASKIEKVQISKNPWTETIEILRMMLKFPDRRGNRKSFQSL